MDDMGGTAVTAGIDGAQEYALGHGDLLLADILATACMQARSVPYDYHKNDMGDAALVAESAIHQLCEDIKGKTGGDRRILTQELIHCMALLEDLADPVVNGRPYKGLSDDDTRASIAARRTHVAKLELLIGVKRDLSVRQETGSWPEKPFRREAAPEFRQHAAIARSRKRQHRHLREFIRKHPVIGTALRALHPDPASIFPSSPLPK